MKEEVRIKGLDLDKRSKVRIEEVLSLRLEAEVRKQAIDKQERKSHSILNSF